LFGIVLKGRGFQPRRKCREINPALAAEGDLSSQSTFSAAQKARDLFFARNCFCLTAVALAPAILSTNFP